VVAGMYTKTAIRSKAFAPSPLRKAKSMHDVRQEEEQKRQEAERKRQAKISKKTDDILNSIFGDDDDFGLEPPSCSISQMPITTETNNSTTEIRDAPKKAKLPRKITFAIEGDTEGIDGPLGAESKTATISVDELFKEPGASLQKLSERRMHARSAEW